MLYFASGMVRSQCRFTGPMDSLCPHRFLPSQYGIFPFIRPPSGTLPSVQEDDHQRTSHFYFPRQFFLSLSFSLSLSHHFSPFLYALIKVSPVFPSSPLCLHLSARFLFPVFSLSAYSSRTSVHLRPLAVEDVACSFLQPFANPFPTPSRRIDSVPFTPFAFPLYYRLHKATVRDEAFRGR